MFNLITTHANLMRTDNRFQSVSLTKALRDIRTELQTHATLARPPTRLGLRISPQHLHHQPRLAGLSLLMSVQLADIIKRDLVIREETSVEHEELASDQGSEGQRTEGLREELEGAFVILRLALALEAVDAVHVVRLVVAAVEEEVVGVEKLVGV